MREKSTAERFLKGRRLKQAEKTLRVNSPVKTVTKVGAHRKITFRDGSVRRVTKKRIKAIMDQELTREYSKKQPSRYGN